MGSQQPGLNGKGRECQSCGLEEWGGSPRPLTAIIGQTCELVSRDLSRCRRGWCTADTQKILILADSLVWVDRARVAVGWDRVYWWNKSDHHWGALRAWSNSSEGECGGQGRSGELGDASGRSSWRQLQRVWGWGLGVGDIGAEREGRWVARVPWRWAGEGKGDLKEEPTADLNMFPKRRCARRVGNCASAVSLDKFWQKHETKTMIQLRTLWYLLYCLYNEASRV